MWAASSSAVMGSTRFGDPWQAPQARSAAPPTIMIHRLRPLIVPPGIMGLYRLKRGTQYLLLTGARLWPNIGSGAPPRAPKKGANMPNLRRYAAVAAALFALVLLAASGAAQTAEPRAELPVLVTSCGQSIAPTTIKVVLQRLKLPF